MLRLFSLFDLGIQNLEDVLLFFKLSNLVFHFLFELCILFELQFDLMSELLCQLLKLLSFFFLFLQFVR